MTQDLEYEQRALEHKENLDVGKKYNLEQFEVPQNAIVP